jgi:hypothetical protein
VALRRAPHALTRVCRASEPAPPGGDRANDHHGGGEAIEGTTEPPGCRASYLGSCSCSTAALPTLPPRDLPSSRPRCRSRSGSRVCPRAKRRGRAAPRALDARSRLLGAGSWGPFPHTASPLSCSYSAERERSEHLRGLPCSPSLCSSCTLPHDPLGAFTHSAKSRWRRARVARICEEAIPHGGQSPVIPGVRARVRGPRALRGAPTTRVH